MIEPKTNVVSTRSRGKQSTSMHGQDNKEQPHTAKSQKNNPKFSSSSKTRTTSKLAAIACVKRRWPGIVILTNRDLDNELGVAVYFTFPGSQYMAVWFSGTDELGLVPEDRPSWEAFVVASNGVRNTSIIGI